MTLSVTYLLTPQQSSVLRLLRRQGEISRIDIARIMDWSRAKVSNEVNVLIQKGLVEEIGEGKSAGGRRPQILSINHELGYVVGIDIGATSIDLALADMRGKILDTLGEPADVRNAPEIVLGRCSALICEMLQKRGGRPEQILGIGVGVPGPVEFSRGVLVAPPLMPLWEYYPIREFFRRTFIKASIVVDNDVNIMAVGELFAGGGSGIEHMIFIKIGTGIGAGIVSYGRIHRGANGCAGDIGHICVDKSGPVCRCGYLGCLEAVTAGPAIAEKAIAAARSGQSPILERMLAANGGSLRAEDVAAAIREGDRTALEIVQTSGQIIGETIASLVNFFNPSHIFIGGGVARIGNQFLSSIRQAVLHRSLPLATRHLVIDYSTLGSQAGITGAVHLALDHLFETIE